MLIPWLGLWGAAIATAVSMIFEAAALSFTVWRKLGIVMAIFMPGDRGSALMAAVPLLEEMSGSPSGAMIAELAGLAGDVADQAHIELLEGNRPLRRLAIYPASAGFDLVEELDHLCARTIEPNVFFNPRFLAPAMPRLEDREVRLAVIRDGDEDKSRLRLLVPFSVDRPAIPLGVPVMRTWSSPFGPLGTPLVDRDDPAGVIEDFFAMLARPHLKLPKVLVLPEMRLDGPVASLLGAVAESRGLTLRHHQRGRAAVPRKQARRRRLSEGVAAGRIICANSSRLQPAARPSTASSSTIVARTRRRHPPRPGSLPDAGGGRLEGPRAHRHGGRPLPRRLRPRGGASAVRTGHVPRPLADARRQGDRLPDRLHRGRHRLHLEDRLRREPRRSSRRARC